MMQMYGVNFFGYTAIRTLLYSNGLFLAVGTGNKTNPWVAATQDWIQ
ncbi:hypothetical protein NXW94_30545 [Bacteroides ovatus]|nr:hypothetical protein [Bacteroides ovatus]